MRNSTRRAIMIAAGIVVILALAPEACRERRKELPTEPGPETVTVGIRTNLTATPFTDPEVLRTLPVGTKLEARYSRLQYLQVATEDGLIGWIPRRTLQEGGTLWVRRQAPLIERPGPLPTAKALVPEGQKVERIGGPAPEGQPTKVRTEAGEIGFIQEAYLRPVALRYPSFPEIWVPWVRLDHLERWLKGRDLASIERHLGPAMTVHKDDDGVLKAHWPRVPVVKDGLRHRGIDLRFVGDEPAIEIKGDGRRYLTERIPGGPGMRALPAWGPMIKLRVLVVEQFQPWYERSAWVRWPARIFGLVLFFGLLGVPYFFAVAIMPIVGRLTFLSNNILDLVVAIPILIVAYLHFLLLAQVVSGEAWGLWLAGVTVGTVIAFSFVSSWIRYQRCPFCRSVHTVSLLHEQELSREHLNVWTGRRRQFVRYEASINTRFYREYDTYKEETVITSDQYFRCEKCGEEYVLKIERDVAGHV